MDVRVLGREGALELLPRQQVPWEHRQVLQRELVEHGLHPRLAGSTANSAVGAYNLWYTDDQYYYRAYC